MKKKKAAGEDKIPNEAWLYGEEKIAEELHRIINKIWNGEQEKIPEEWKIGIVIYPFTKKEKYTMQGTIEEYKNLVPEAMEKSEYLWKENNWKRAMEMKARFRLGTETKANKYWEIEENRICRLCGKEEETLQHVFEMCEIIGEKHESWKQQINGVRALARMWSITWKRKREEEKLVQQTEEEEERTTRWKT